MWRHLLSFITNIYIYHLILYLKKTFKSTFCTNNTPFRLLHCFPIKTSTIDTGCVDSSASTCLKETVGSRYNLVSDTTKLPHAPIDVVR